MLFEVCVDCLESAQAAQRGGAGRLELCSALSEGGLTPSPGLVEAVLEQVSIPIAAMLRPRGGGFVVDDTEFSLMRRDLRWLSRSGVHAVVTGLLTGQGAVDTRRMRILADEIHGLPLVFHRAFDGCADPFKALDDLAEIGVSRLLTSGQAPSAFEGRGLIRALVQRSLNLFEGKITVMPGGGITPANIRAVVQETGAQEVHFSASAWREEPLGGVAAGGRRVTTAEKVKEWIDAWRLSE